MTGKHYLPEHDDILRKVEDGRLLLPIAQRLGKSERQVRLRWQLLRAGKPPRATDYNRIWSRADDQYLRDTVGMKPIAEICEALKRTPVAVRIRAKRLGLRWVKGSKRQPAQGLTARAVAQMLGVRCQKTVVRWIADGYMVGEKRPVRYGTSAVWRIWPEAVERFLREYRWLYNPERIVDPGWRRVVASLPLARYVGVAEAAHRLCYTISGVNQLIRKGDLPAEKHGPNWKIAEKDIAAFVPPPLAWGHMKDARVGEGVRARRTAILASRKTGRATVALAAD